MTKQKSDTALLVMDMQEKLLSTLPGSNQLIPDISKAITHARENGIPVIYVTVAFRPGFPEIHAEHKSFGQLPSRMPYADTGEMMKIAPEIAPADGDVVVVKRRFSAFTGSDLEVILRSNGIRHLVLSGVVTSGVVLATLMEAADKDYRLTVLSDGCMDRDTAVHEMLIGSIFTRVADIKTCEDWSN